MAGTRTDSMTDGNASRAGGPGRAPSTPTNTVGSTKRRASRNRGRMAVGVLVMAACALAGGLAFAKVADRSPVLVIAQPVRAGEVIEAADLREVLVGSNPSGSTIAASQRSSVVGRTAAADLVVGSFLARGQLATGPVAGTGQVVIGATLKEGQFPIELATGDRVLVVVLPLESAEAVGATTSGPKPVEANVVGIRPLDDGGGVAISLAVAPAQAPALAIAGARSRLTLLLAAR